MTDTESIALPLIQELWAEHEHRHHCPYVRHDDKGCYCTSPRLPAGADRFMVCDIYSVQIWCLDEDHYTRCHFWPAGDVP
jgi:hypothetical protein